MEEDYRRALNQWARKRNDRLYEDFTDIQYLIDNYLQRAAKCYIDQTIKNQKTEASKCYTILKNGLNDMVKVLQTSGEMGVEGKHPGTTRFMKFLYDKFFKKGHETFKKSLSEVTRPGGRPPTVRDTAIRDILTLPNTYFPNWNTLFMPEITTILRPPQAERPKLTGKPSKSSFEVATKKKRPAPPPEGTQVTARALGGAFPIKEPLGVKEFATWSSLVLMFQPISENEDSGGNEGLRKMVSRTRRMFTTLQKDDWPRTDDLWLLRQEAQFWLEEFFNFLLTPCEFANPAYLENSHATSKYRTHVILPLTKLVLISQDREKRIPEKAEQTSLVFSPMMTQIQWREYLSLNFPDAAASLFGEEVKHPEFFQEHAHILQTLKSIEDMFVFPAAGQTTLVTAELKPRTKKRERSDDADVGELPFEKGVKFEDAGKFEDVEFEDVGEFDEGEFEEGEFKEGEFEEGEFKEGEFEEGEFEEGEFEEGEFEEGEFEEGEFEEGEFEEGEFEEGEFEGQLEEGEFDVEKFEEGEFDVGEEYDEPIPIEDASEEIDILG
jgi:hypothetical protein